MPYALYNQQLIKEDDLKLPIQNRGFLYGDGFFETIVFANNELKYFNAHYARLCKAAKASNIILPASMSLENLEKQLVALIDKNELEGMQRIRITCWRSGLGLYTPEGNTAQVLMTVSQGTTTPACKQNVGVFTDMYKPYSTLSFCKTLSANIYVQASIARQALQLDDLIILGSNKVIAECCSSNIFFIQNKSVFTPTLESGCIDGIMRNEIVKWCSENGIICNEIMITIDELSQFEMAFTANVTGLSSIASIDGINYLTQHPIYERLKEKFNLIPQ